MSALDTLLSPIILFFILGALAATARSDLAIPEPIAKAISLYLMAAIGLKGGVQVSAVGFSPEMGFVSVAGILLSFTLPLLAFALVRTIGKLDRLNAGAVAAHYGSVSIVTFVTATEALTRGGMAPAGYLVAVMALMETPAILTGLILARSSGGKSPQPGRSHLLREVLFNGSVVMLLGSFIIGLIIGKTKFEAISPVFVSGFSGILCLFLLDMGLVAARRLRESKAISFRLASLGIVIPLLNGCIGLAVTMMIGLEQGTAAAFAILAASASYIAVPAAVRMALPEADPGIYLPLSLAITFPFNIVIGIPLFTALASAFAN